MRDFLFINWFSQKKPSGLLIITKFFYFRNKFAEIFDFLYILSMCTDSFEISQYTNKFILHIPSMCTASFCIFPNTHNKNKFEDLSYAYPEYMFKFIPRILRIRTGSFCIFSVKVQIHSASSANAPKKIQIYRIKLFSSQLTRDTTEKNGVKVNCWS